MGSQSLMLMKNGGNTTGAELLVDTRMLEEGYNDTPEVEERSDNVVLPLTKLRPESRNTNWTSVMRAYVWLECVF